MRNIPREIELQTKYNLTGGDRTVSEYTTDLGNGILAGLRSGDWVLEVGPGETQKFARHLAAVGVHMVLVGPHFENESIREISAKLDEKTGEKVYTVTNKAELTPLGAEGTYKKAIGYYSVPMYCKNSAAQTVAFTNILDSLLIGGRGYFFPLTRTERDVFERNFFQRVKIIPTRKKSLLVFEKIQ